MLHIISFSHGVHSTLMSSVNLGLHYHKEVQIYTRRDGPRGYMGTICRSRFLYFVD